MIAVIVCREAEGAEEVRVRIDFIFVFVGYFQKKKFWRLLLLLLFYDFCGVIPGPFFQIAEVANHPS